MLFRIGLTILSFAVGSVAFATVSILPSAPAVLHIPFLTPLLQKEEPITIGFVGDMAPADAAYNAAVFNSVAPYLQKPDLMIGNLEGTFAEEYRISKCNYIEFLCFAFRGDASFADALKEAGFDFISLVNNHSYDYGEAGMLDTTRELDRVGIPYITQSKPATSITVKGKTIGILGLSSTKPMETISDYAFIKKMVEKLKSENDFVIVIFHGGAEGSDKTLVPNTVEYVGSENRGDVRKVAHSAIDAGADLVLGSGPHVLRKVEKYNRSIVAYSLGNFVGGNGKMVTRGLLGISGILTTTLSKDIAPYTSFTSVKLTPNGVPLLDEADRGRLLLESLSR